MKVSQYFRFTAAAMAAITLAGCASNLSPQLAKDIEGAPVGRLPKTLPANEGMYGSDDNVIARGDALRSTKVVRHSSLPYIGGRMVASTNEDALPAVFTENYVLDFGEGRSSLAVIAATLTKKTGVPVRLRSDVYRQGGPVGGLPMPGSQGMVAPMPTPLPPGGPAAMRAAANSGFPVTAPAMAVPVSSNSNEASITIDSVNMKWNGRLRDFLDHLTNSLALAWEYRDGAVVIMRMVSETYELASFPGQQKYTNSTGGNGSGHSGQSGQSGQTQSSSASMNISQQGEGDARKSILETVKSMLVSVPGSTAMISDGTGRIVVTTSKEVQAQVRDYLRAENKHLRQMVNVTFDVYSYRTSDNDTQGMDWNLILKSIGGRGGINISSPSSQSSTNSGSIGVSILSGAYSGSSAVLNLMRQFQTSVQHRPVTMNTLNGIWDTKTRLNTEGYLKETTPGVASSSGAAGAPGLKTDTITTGDQFAVLPLVMQDNSVMLKYAIGLSDNLGFHDVTSGNGESAQKVQTPRIESANANSTIMLAPGQTAVITGLSRVISTSNDSRLTANTPIAFGGSRSVNLQREHFMVLVRATPL